MRSDVIESVKRLEKASCTLSSKRYEDMTLPELLETRDKIKDNKKAIQKVGLEQRRPKLFEFAMARLQQHIHRRRTIRASGLIIPYNSDIDYD